MKNGKLFLGILIGAGAFMLMSFAANNLQQEAPKVEIPRYHIVSDGGGVFTYDAVSGDYKYFSPIVKKKSVEGNIADRMEINLHPMIRKNN